MRKIFMFIFVLCLILLTGCEGRIELNDLSMVTMIGIDWDAAKQEYQITQNVVKFSRAKKQILTARNNSWVASASGKTLREAVTNFDDRASRRHTGAALSIVLIGKDAGEHGIDEIIDFLVRNREYRDTINILTTNTEASEIMKLLPEHETDIQKEIEGTVEYSDWLRSYTPTLRQVFIDYNENYGDVVTGAVFAGSPDPFSEVPRKESKNVEDPKQVAYISGSAVYNKGKLVGFMDDIDTRAFLLITRKADNMEGKTDTVPNLKDEKENIDASVEVKSVSSKTKINADKNINMNIFVDLNAILDELTTPTNVDTNTIDKIGDLLNEKVKTQIEAMISKTQNVYDSDIIGVYNTLHEKYPDIWKKNKDKWKEVYPNIKFNVTVHSKITKTGLITNSILEK